MAKFSDWKDIAKQLQNDLPKPLNERRCRLLPKILQEWGRTDLQQHLALELSGAIIRTRIKKLEAVRKGALQLMKAINSVDEESRNALVAQMAIAERGGYTPGVFRGADFATRDERLREESEFLAKLAAVRPHEYWPLKSRQPRTIAAYLVLQDAAAIYKWLTGRRAARGVDRITARESGPFFRFASTLWPVVFGKGTAGLPSAMKTWDENRRQSRERSPLLFNMASRHPTWGIFEP
jgi:hypothetical protein